MGEPGPSAELQPRRQRGNRGDRQVWARSLSPQLISLAIVNELTGSPMAQFFDQLAFFGVVGAVTVFLLF